MTARKTEDRHEDRPRPGEHTRTPIHPECTRLSNVYATCTCEILWGCADSLASLLPIHERLDRRTQVGRHTLSGPGPDLDEADPARTPDVSPSLDDNDDLRGYWKESEFLRGFVKQQADDDS